MKISSSDHPNLWGFTIKLDDHMIFINQSPEILVLSTFPIDLQTEALN